MTLNKNKSINENKCFSSSHRVQTLIAICVSACIKIAIMVAMWITARIQVVECSVYVLASPFALYAVYSNRKQLQYAILIIGFICVLFAPTRILNATTQYVTYVEIEYSSGEYSAIIVWVVGAIGMLYVVLEVYLLVICALFYADEEKTTAQQYQPTAPLYPKLDMKSRLLRQNHPRSEVPCGTGTDFYASCLSL